MAKFYKILKADPLGDPYTPNVPNAKPLQTYWCQFEGVEKAVSMGKQVGNSPQLGSHVYGDLMYAKSQKGTEYWKFKSAKVPDGVQRPADSPAQAVAQQAVGDQPNVSSQVPGWFLPFGNMIEFIYKEMKSMSESQDVPTEDPVPTTVEESPLDDDTKEMLDDLFTPSTEE